MKSTQALEGERLACTVLRCLVLLWLWLWLWLACNHFRMLQVTGWGLLCLTCGLLDGFPEWLQSVGWHEGGGGGAIPADMCLLTPGITIPLPQHTDGHHLAPSHNLNHFSHEATLTLAGHQGKPWILPHTTSPTAITLPLSTSHRSTSFQLNFIRRAALCSSSSIPPMFGALLGKSGMAPLQVSSLLGESLPGREGSGVSIPNDGGNSCWFCSSCASSAGWSSLAPSTFGASFPYSSVSVVRVRVGSWKLSASCGLSVGSSSLNCMRLVGVEVLSPSEWLESHAT
ncbi:hypothetical protein E2C01_033863 [Portunus trituberculatus]|uniref:Uncharacterized protein n=1 Tax=Portunus trituberculatus TaxID=210409 RepID=A0A5B7F426_PORTR|nr:hypothetical protein [Portunus trituberculatus]